MVGLRAFKFPQASETGMERVEEWVEFQKANNTNMIDDSNDPRNESDYKAAMERHIMRPFCGECGRLMTPENSTVMPDLFLCDHCAAATQTDETLRRLKEDHPSQKHLREALAMIVELQNENRTLRETLSRNGELRAACEGAAITVEVLEEEAKKLRKDKQRLDWLGDNWEKFDPWDRFVSWPKPESLLRVAIDSAMSEDAAEKWSAGRRGPGSGDVPPTTEAKPNAKVSDHADSERGA